MLEAFKSGDLKVSAAMKVQNDLLLPLIDSFLELFH